jgi:Zn-dependent protease
MLERISRQERLDLLIAWGAISLAFSLIFRDNFELIRIFPDPLIRFIFSLMFSMVTVGIGFVAHEMAHKFTAMKYGFWAEFRKDNTMLVVAVALAALVGVVFAAPGATVIYDSGRFGGGGINREQNGKISAAGPLTNLLLCIPFAGLLLYGGASSNLTGNVATLIGMIGLQVNAMIAAFNMLPVSVLDGRKVLAWNPVVFAILIVAAFGTLLLSFYPNLLL